ncbi:molybdopterin-dependent oxidoreductase [Conexivisphaera calida]|uniref:Anaerobic dimethyl sulfoxide reductase chain A n=1 Tax=Conexivisphaera calida TaxID=1874277 RepID=A0A4P2VBV9_9ARCH|nr:molybdopterin-dependent oxidoreductase [Conexivisphaera calida]BBE42026.1 Anaerobic dimethyl sulfoxide reductase chain A [Conexivisphaera calida]
MVSGYVEAVSSLSGAAGPGAGGGLLRRIERGKREPARGTRYCYIASSLCGFTLASLPVVAQCEGDRIVRVLPFHIPEDVRLYRIRTRRGAFTRPRRAPASWHMFAWRQRVHSPTRVRYPLKRVDWSPEARNTQNRGRSKFVRISWEEAIEIVVKEIERQRRIYGSTETVLVQADGHGQSGFLHTLHAWGHHLFRALGTGWTQQDRNPDSWEGFYWGAKHVWGFDPTVGRPPSDAIWDDVLENSEMVILSGGDPETTANAWYNMMGTTNMLWIRRAGIKVVAISPDLNYTAAVHADKWIPIRPNTDAALYFAIAYLWLQWGTYDGKFLETHTVGFEEFRKYILGEEDGTPKTPEWAERITGVPVETIKALARAWARRRTAMASHYGGPKIRGVAAHLAARAEAYAMMMQGLGAPGRQFLSFQLQYNHNGLKLPPVPVYPEVMARGIPVQTVRAYTSNMPRREAIPLIKTLVPDAILNPPVEWYGSGSIVAPTRDQFNRYVYPPTGDHPGIHMIWNENASVTTCWNGGWRWIQAYRDPRVEFIVAIHPWLEDDVYFADLILPTQTVFEHEDMAAAKWVDVWGIYWQDRCLEPVGESMSDYEVHRLIARRLGIGDEWFPEPEEALRRAYEATLAHAKYGISWEEFRERRKIILYDAPTPEEWEEIKRRTEVMPGVPVKSGLRWYYELPEGRGLNTKSGKLEFVSGWLKDYFPNDRIRPPLARWVEHDELPTSPKTKKYPLQVMSNHPRWRHHAQGDDMPWIREIRTAKIKGPDGYYYEPLWINPKDAAKRGIKHGDIVRVYNERGAVLAAAFVTERIREGVVGMSDGSKLDPISLEDRIDRGGAINLITPASREVYDGHQPGPVIVPEMSVSGFLVEVERADMEELRRKYPEAFRRTERMDPARGPGYESWVA